MGRGNARQAILFGLDCDTLAACDMHGLYTEWRWRERVWVHMPPVCCMPATGNNSGLNEKAQREAHNADDNADATPSNAPQSNNATAGCYVVVNGSIEEANVGEKAASQRSGLRCSTRSTEVNVATAAWALGPDHVLSSATSGRVSITMSLFMSPPATATIYQRTAKHFI